MTRDNPVTAAIDPQELRRALGRFTTGVTIVSTVDPQGQWVGLTANSFNSLSLDPPLVLWSLREASAKLPVFAAAPRFAVNVLADTQVELSNRFAGRAEAPFAEGDWSLGAHGSPVLAGCVAVFECALHAQHATGDHRLFIGRVLACHDAGLAPLVYQAGQYRALADS